MTFVLTKRKLLNLTKILESPLFFWEILGPRGSVAKMVRTIWYAPFYRISIFIDIRLNFDYHLIYGR